MSQTVQAILENLQNNGICTKLLNKTVLSGDGDRLKLSTDTGNVFVKTNSGLNSHVMFEGKGNYFWKVHV